MPESRSSKTFNNEDIARVIRLWNGGQKFLDSLRDKALRERYEIAISKGLIHLRELGLVTQNSLIDYYLNKDKHEDPWVEVICNENDGRIPLQRAFVEDTCFFRRMQELISEFKSKDS